MRADINVIRVLLADDETLVRAGIRTLLELVPGVEVVAEAADGDDALRLLNQDVDVGLLDVRMPRRGGIDVLHALGARSDAPPCLLLTTFDDREALLAGIRAGARGYLRKDVTVEALVRAIRTLADGGTFFQPSLTEKLLRGVKRKPGDGLPPPPDLVEPLTSRETEVMRLVAGGYSNREIGEALGTAESTVKVHVSSILSKLGVRDRVQAVLRVLEAGLI
jgi:DNA-binding NarL/FixJ family response regulator